jgi:hypothetical protein
MGDDFAGIANRSRRVVGWTEKFRSISRKKRGGYLLQQVYYCRYLSTTQRENYEFPASRRDAEMSAAASAGILCKTPSGAVTGDIPTTCTARL